MIDDSPTVAFDLALVGLTLTDAMSSGDMKEAKRTLRGLQEVYTRDEILEALLYTTRLMVSLDATNNGISQGEVINIYRGEFLRLREYWASQAGN